LIDEMQRCGVAALFLIKDAIKEMIDLTEYSLSGSVAYIRNLLEVCLAQPTIDGDVNSFHNLSVVLANVQMYYEASEVIKKGLSVYPRSPDLLADFIAYGMNCGRQSECSDIYDIIVNDLPREMWTWRVYDFCIDYLFKKIEVSATTETISCELAKIEKLTDEYIKMFGDKELSYYAKANYFDFVRQHENQISVLEKAVRLLPKTPQCSLSLAQIKFQKCDYITAIGLLESCKQYINPIDKKSELGQIYLLLTFCRIANFLRIRNMKEGEVINIDEYAKKVHNDYRAASETKIVGSEMFSELTEVLHVFSIESGVSFY